MRKTYFPRLAIRAVQVVEKLREKFTFTYEQFKEIYMYLLFLAIAAGVFAGSLLYVILTQ